MREVSSLLIWIIVTTIIIVTLGMLSPTIWMVFSMYMADGRKDESKDIHLTGLYLQAQTVRYEGARWAVDNNDFNPSYEDEISISGKKIDLEELKKIINKTEPNLIFDAHILEVYEIAPDELLLKVSTGYINGNNHQFVIIRLKVTATANTWKIYKFNRHLDSFPHSISQSIIPGWVQIDDRLSPQWLHLVDTNSSRAYSFYGWVMNVDYPYVVLGDYPVEDNTEESKTTDTVFKVVNMQNGKTESELKLPYVCYVFPQSVTNMWDARSLTNSWAKYFNFDRNSVAVTFQKQYRRTFRNPATYSSSHCAVD